MENNGNKPPKPQQSEDKLTIEYDRQDFETSLPNLAEELLSPEKGLAMEINELKHPYQSIQDPQAIDFLRRCSKDSEAEEIIAYLEQRQEISGDEAAQLRQQLKTQGLRSFGSFKQHGYYEHTYRQD